PSRAPIGATAGRAHGNTDADAISPTVRISGRVGRPQRARPVELSAPVRLAGSRRPSGARGGPLAPSGAPTAELTVQPFSRPVPRRRGSRPVLCPRPGDRSGSLLPPASRARSIL